MAKNKCSKMIDWEEKVDKLSDVEPNRDAVFICVVAWVFLLILLYVMFV